MYIVGIDGRIDKEYAGRLIEGIAAIDAEAFAGSGWGRSVLEEYAGNDYDVIAAAVRNHWETEACGGAQETVACRNVHEETIACGGTHEMMDCGNVHEGTAACGDTHETVVCEDTHGESGYIQEGTGIKECVVGYVILRCIGDGEILRIAVGSAYRGQGIGTKLMEYAIAEAKGRGMSAVFLEVRAHNEAARRLYQRLGFKDMGIRKRYYHAPPDDAVIMELGIYGQ